MLVATFRLTCVPDVFNASHAKSVASLTLTHITTITRVLKTCVGSAPDTTRSYTVLLSGFKVPVAHLSASSLGDFLTCPEKWRLERVVKIRRRQHMDGFIGAVHHATLAQNLTQKVETGTDQTLEQVASAYRYLWAETIEKEGEPEWKDHPERVEKLGLQMAEAFHTGVAPTIEPLAVETRFEERIPGVPVPIIGFIDTEERHVLDEFKTAKQKVSSPKPNWRFQASVYQLFVRKPVHWTVTTKQKTPVNWDWRTAPDLVMPVGNPDITVDLIVKGTAMLNDFWLRYGPDYPWPMTGLMHPWQCNYCSAGPAHPAPACGAWKGRDPSDPIPAEE